MAAERENNFGEKVSIGFRNLFLVGVLIGSAAMVLAIPFAETLFVGGAGGAVVGEGGRRLAGAGEKKKP